MATLNGRTISASYTELLKTTDASGVTSSLDTVQDGDATDSALQISTAGVKSTGTLETTGDTTLGANLTLGGATVAGIKDEDTMSSDSPTHLSTQQSIKAYVDGKTHLALGTTSSTALAGDTTTISVGQASAITANTAKVSNATHTSEVTGDTALTVADDVIDEANLKGVGTPTNNDVLTADSTATGGMKWAASSGSGTVTSVTAGSGMTQSGTSTVNPTLDVVGTADRITANADDIDIASTYVGQTSITTLGTVATGTWEGTEVAVAKGGTGSTTASAARTALGAAADAFTQAGTGAEATTVDAKLKESVSVKDFGATGNGTDDDTEAIQAAVDSFSAGGTVYVPEGTYLVSDPADVAIDAAIILPDSVNFIMSKGAWLTVASSFGSFIAPKGNNIITCNIDGDGYPASGVITDDWTNENVGIRSYGSAALGLGAENVIVYNSEMKNVTHGIQAYGAKSWRVYGNRIHRFKETGLLFGFYLAQDCKYNIFTANNFEDSGDAAIAFFQVGGYAAGGYGSYNTVSENIAKDCNQRTNGYAYDVEAGDAAYQDHFIFSNNIYETTKTGGTYTFGGITVSSTTGSVVDGNIVKGSLNSNGDTGINVQYSESCLITNNHVDNFRGAGIKLDGLTGVLVSGNMIKNCGDESINFSAINIALTKSTQDVFVEGNTLIIDSDYPHYDDGVAAIACNVATGKTVKNISITNNKITNPNDHGIAVNGITGNTIKNVDISLNTINGIDAGAFYQRHPITVSFLEGFAINGNIMYQPVRVGITSRGISIKDSDKGIFAENVIRGTNTIAQLYTLTNTTNLTIRNNEVTSPFTDEVTPNDSITDATLGNFFEPLIPDSADLVLMNRISTGDLSLRTNSLERLNIEAGGRVTVKKSSNSEITDLVDDATIDIDFDDANNFKLLTTSLVGNSPRELQTPSNITAGQSGCIVITQDGSGSRALTYTSAWHFEVGTDPTLSTAADAVDTLAYYCPTDAIVQAVLLKDLK